MSESLAETFGWTLARRSSVTGSRVVRYLSNIELRDRIDPRAALVLAGFQSAAAASWFWCWRSYRTRKGRTDLPPEREYNAGVNVSNAFLAIAFLVSGVATLVLALLASL